MWNYTYTIFCRNTSTNLVWVSGLCLKECLSPGTHLHWPSSYFLFLAEWSLSKFSNFSISPIWFCIMELRREQLSSSLSAFSLLAGVIVMWEDFCLFCKAANPSLTCQNTNVSSWKPSEIHIPRFKLLDFAEH